MESSRPCTALMTTRKQKKTKSERRCEPFTCSLFVIRVFPSQTVGRLDEDCTGDCNDSIDQVVFTYLPTSIRGCSVLIAYCRDESTKRLKLIGKISSALLKKRLSPSQPSTHPRSRAVGLFTQGSGRLCVYSKNLLRNFRASQRSRSQAF